MKKGYVFLVIVAGLLIGSVGVASAQSLADLARKEKARREKVKEQVKVVTNDSASKYEGGAVTTSSLPKPAKADETGKPEEKSQPAEADEATDFQGRTESFWRQTFRDARKRIADLENQANVITLRIADLQNRFYAESDGFKQQDLQREIQKAFYEQDLNKEELAKARKQLADLETEARKSGALPGWIETRPDQP